MNRDDNEIDDTQDGIVPEHLKYIDEKEAKEHKRQLIELEETKDECPERLSDVLKEIQALSPRLENQTNFPAVYSRNRFTCKVPDHFICSICSNVVKIPQECQSCENLLCKECIENTSECPFGCHSFKCKPLAKFAANVYLSLTLDCKNKPFGCPYSGTIKSMQAHEENCLFIMVKCENSLCDRFILKKVRTKDQSTLLCSEVCENLLGFSSMINENNPLETLKHFTVLSERSKKLVEYEVKTNMQDKYRRIEESKRENELFKKKKEKLEKDIEKWLNSNHPGKWNLRTSKWTCCGSSELVAVGCKYTA